MHKKLVLTENFLDNYKNRPVAWGYGDLGFLTYLRTYSRTQENAQKEAWWMSVRRAVEGCYNAQIEWCHRMALPFDMTKGQYSAQRMYDLIFNFKWLPPGRGLEHMGAESLYQKGAGVLFNCSSYSTKDLDRDFVRPFTYLMDFSALGVGVAGDTRGAGKRKIMKPGDGEYHFQIPDSREGWVESLRVLLTSYATGKPLPTFDYSLIRPSGALLRTLGGTASGPGPLKEMHESIRKVLDPLIGKPITSTAIVDIFDFIGKCIVSGGARRSAILMLGHPEDTDFLSLKDPISCAKELKNHRWAANHSVCIESDDHIGFDYGNLANGISKNGEPGVLWLHNVQRYGRMVDSEGEWDPDAILTNPCGEISLEGNGELCNLATIYPARHDSLDDLYHTAKFAYLYCKSVTLIPTHDPAVNSVIGRNRRIGLCISGIAQSIKKFGYSNLIHTLDDLYGQVRSLDRMYSRWLCVPTSIKMTSVKPDGTTGLISGATPGVHFPHSEYYIRRLRVQIGSPIVDACKKAGYHVEPSVYGDNTMVISFPIHEKDYLLSKNDVTMYEQLNLAADMQRFWSDNQVSVTVSFKEHEASKIPLALEAYSDRLKSVSFLPLKDHSYEQAVYEEITKEQYRAMASKIKSFVGSHIEKDSTERFCDGEACLIGA